MSLDTAAPRRGARGGKHSPGKPRTKKPAKQKGFFRRWWWLIVGLPLLGLLVVGGTLVWVYVHLELPATLPPLQSTYIYDRNGDLLTTFHGAVDRTTIAPGKITDTVKHAILAAEDDGFYQHPGIDPLGIARAAWTDLVQHATVQGGSTITQQVVKNVYAGTYSTDADGVVTYTVPPRSIGQKVREALLAVKLESEQTKDQILATYLNTIYFGHGAYGIQAASKTYFGVGEDELTVSQAALLAGLVRSPGFYDPAVKGNEQVAKDRRNYVLDQMVENGWLDATQATTLKAQKIQLHLAPDTFNTPGDSEYFVEYTKHQLTERFGGAKVFGGGLRVTTTIDLALQRDAEAAVQQHLPTPGDPAAAVVTIDAQTGQILTMVGGKNFARSQVNLGDRRGRHRPAGGLGVQAVHARRRHGRRLRPAEVLERDDAEDHPAEGVLHGRPTVDAVERFRRGERHLHAEGRHRVLRQHGVRAGDRAARSGPRRRHGAPARHPLAPRIRVLGDARHPGGEPARDDECLRHAGRPRRADARDAVDLCQRPTQAAGADRVRQAPQPAAATGAAAERRRSRHVGACRASWTSARERPPTSGGRWPARPARPRTTWTRGSAGTCRRRRPARPHRTGTPRRRSSPPACGSATPRTRSP